MSLWKMLWHDDWGAVVSAEAVVVGTVGVVGATVGLSAASQSIDAELDDVARSIRSLDQSYSLRGFRTARAHTAASSFRQPDVAESLAELDALQQQWRQQRPIPSQPLAEPETERSAAEAPPASGRADGEPLEPEFPAAL